MDKRAWLQNYLAKKRAQFMNYLDFRIALIKILIFVLFCSYCYKAIIYLFVID